MVVFVLPYTKSTRVDVRQEGDSNGRIAGNRNGGGGAQGECVIYPKGIRDVSSASDTVMDDLNLDAQPWSSSFYRIPKVLEWM